MGNLTICFGSRCIWPMMLVGRGDGCGVDARCGSEDERPFRRMSFKNATMLIGERPGTARDLRGKCGLTDVVEQTCTPERRERLSRHREKMAEADRENGHVHGMDDGILFVSVLPAGGDHRVPVRDDSRDEELHRRENSRAGDRRSGPRCPEEFSHERTDPTVHVRPLGDLRIRQIAGPGRNGRIADADVADALLMQKDVAPASGTDACLRTGDQLDERKDLGPRNPSDRYPLQSYVVQLYVEL